MRLHVVAIAAFAILHPGLADAAKFDAGAVNTAGFNAKVVKRLDPALVKAQILLDRAGYSPGEIDGHDGDNFAKALAAFQADHGLPGNGILDQASWDSLVGSNSEPAITDYEIAKSDVKGPFRKRIPAKLEAMAHLRTLAYRNATEGLAEKFHMSPDLLKALNPGERFKASGHHIAAAAVPQPDLKQPKSEGVKAARLEVDKDKLTVRAFDATGKLVGFFPASVGSEDKPAPSGTLLVDAVNFKPSYTYNPKYKFKGVRATKPFTIAAGPNNPVGVVWIGLNEEGYGIHGTPDPGNISKRYSHGCVRLTNWDALMLASMVSKGVPVDFIGNGPLQAEK
jgi:lipoprotein-anchoring transpeptidase ErfK/SrfK